MATPSGLFTHRLKHHELPFQGTLSLWRHMPQWPETTQPLDLQVRPCLNIGLHHWVWGLQTCGYHPPTQQKKNRKWIAKKKIQERFRSASLFSQPCIQYLVIKKRYWPFVAHNFGTSGDSSERWVATCRASFRIHPKRVDLFFKSLMLLQAQIYKGKTCGLMRIVVKENWWKLLRRVTGL